jgi:hypothetical protein
MPLQLLRTLLLYYCKYGEEDSEEGAKNAENYAEDFTERKALSLKMSYLINPSVAYYYALEIPA